MLGAKFLIVRTISGIGIIPDESHAIRFISNSLGASSSCHSTCLLTLRSKRCRRLKKFLICCKPYSFDDNGRFRGRSGNGDGDEHERDYLEASLLIAETNRHHNLRANGHQQDSKWKPYGQLVTFSDVAKTDVNALGWGILHRFKSPTIFLKISCDGYVMLPIIVGEAAVGTLIHASSEDNSGDGPNQFQLLSSLVAKLGYEVKMVRITKRVINTYFARIYFRKPGEKVVLSVDARPSDAINVANRCKAPIYVNRQIVWTDAIKIVYGMGRFIDRKSIYDVTLDSAIEGPDLLTEELKMVKNMNSAAQEERYSDAAIWRDRLTMIRKSRHGQ